MKYPYELSESRLSLLSVQERNRYKYEHSDYFDYTEKQNAINEYRNAYNQSVNSYYNSLVENNSEELTEELQEEYQNIAELMANEQAEYIFETIDSYLYPTFKEGGLTYDEYKYIAEQIKNVLRFDSSSLNEDTVGPDMSFWMKGIGKWISLGFGAVFASMAGLIMLGKTQIAIKQLERYMNEIVEMCDDGINKRRSIFKRIGDKISGSFSKLKSWFVKKDKNREDRSYASFREVQENFLSNYATKAMVFAKQMGFLSGSIDKAMEEVENNTLCQEGSGLNYFMENIGTPINKLVNKN